MVLLLKLQLIEFENEYERDKMEHFEVAKERVEGNSIVIFA